jgi:hypothetical protein
MKDNNNINFYIVINHQDKKYQLLVNYSLTVSKLKKIIITYFKLDQTKYEIFYKNTKLDNNDIRLLSLFFDKDPKPLLYIFNSKNDILPDSKKQTYLTLFTNIPDLKMNEIVEKLFEYKKMKNDAYIKNSIKGMFIINFSKASLCSDFKEFYDNYLRLENIQDSQNKTEGNSKPKKQKLILPLIKNYHRYKEENEEENEKNKYKDEDDKFHDRKKYLNKVILNNSKADIISEKCIRTNKYRIHLDSNKNSLRRKFNNYTGIYKYPYMNNEEKYQREKYLDKKNWLNKQGFIIYSKDKSKDNFIPNYVMATPSKSPLLFNFRNVSKNKWINPKGFL